MYKKLNNLLFTKKCSFNNSLFQTSGILNVQVANIARRPKKMCKNFETSLKLLT